MSGKRIWIVLPAFNEQENLPAIFSGIAEMTREHRGIECRVIVVDDGSRDGTIEAARTKNAGVSVEILENGVNRGLAITFRRGMIAAIGKAADEDVIVCMDADNSHLPSQIPYMLRKLDEGFDLVVSSRYRKGAVIKGVPGHRLMLSRGMGILFQVVYPVRGVRDYSCGFRAYRASLLKKALAEQGDRLFSDEGFACMVYILLRLEKAGARCAEIPLILRYDQKIGASKMNVGKTVRQTLGILWRERTSRD